ncbi:MAG TPA: hypothetical protein PKD51_01670 [Saprospiraceae bacterium]|nr:hypothetical protein [Saprospiraceae bacterium]
MTIIQEIEEKLMAATKPVAKLYYQGEASKTIFIGFKKGMTLDQHKTNIPARLMVLKGQVTYKQGDHVNVLRLYESQDIPVDIMHEVYADEDSLCMLTKG